MPTPSYGLQLGQEMGSQAAHGLVGGIMGMAFAKQNDKRQLKQQKKLSEMQFGFDKQMTDYQFQKQLQMWKDTNYSAQMAELEKAGLNPALLYGMSGGGGTTTGGGAASTHGANAPSGGGEMQGMAITSMNLGLMEAQRKLIEAQTNKTKTEANKIGGVDTDLANTQIKDLTQGIENKKAQQVLTEIQSDLARIDQMFKTRTFDAAVHKLEFETNSAMQEMQILQNEGLISANTWSTRIEMIQTEAAGMLLRNAQTEAQTKLTNQQVDEVIQSIKESVKRLQQGDRSLDQKDKDILIDQERNKLIDKGIEWGAASQVLGKAVDLLTKPKGPGTVETKNKR